LSIGQQTISISDSFMWRLWGRMGQKGAGSVIE